ncbi:MAG: protein-glutamate O-methyltransferase CheR [Mycobacteriales bacterium]
MSLPTTDFELVRRLVAEDSGLALGEGKAYLVEARLAPIAEREGCDSVSALIGRLRLDPGRLRADVAEAMTTNETSFFRDVHPFDALRDTVIPDILRTTGGQISFWSAAASTGQEAYSLAMLMTDHFPVATTTILATDLSRDVLARARSGCFSQLEVNRGLPAPLLVRHFARDGSGWKVSEDIRRRVQFRELNLVRPWPPLPRMDVILLRNILIYLDAPAKRTILTQAERVLAPNGVLFLGGAETTYGLDDTWTRVQVGRTAFYRPANHDEGRR